MTKKNDELQMAKMLPNYGFLSSRGSIVITELSGGKLKGEFKLDDGYVKVSGPFEIDLV